MQTKEKILITVRTYPTPSNQYIETVCTGGINSKGDWRRLYPIDLRYLKENQFFRTYSVIECNITKARNDHRFESHSPNLNTMKQINFLEEWPSRCQWILPTVFDSFEQMKSENRTLAPVAVQSVDGFYAIPDDPEWSAKQQEVLRQSHLFYKNKPLEKIPWKFKIKWTDMDGKQYDSRFSSWEVCETWRKWRTRYENVIEKITEKWLVDVCGTNKSLYFFMGNYAQHPQHFAITGIFNPPKNETQNDTLW